MTHETPGDPSTGLLYLSIRYFWPGDITVGDRDSRGLTPDYGFFMAGIPISCQASPKMRQDSAEHGAECGNIPQPNKNKQHKQQQEVATLGGRLAYCNYY